MMKSIILFLVIFLASIAALADDKKPDPLALSETERREWQQFAQSEKQLDTALNQAISNAVNQPVGEASKEIHAAIQQAWFALNLVRARKEAWLSRLLLERDCKGCGIEGDKLIRPK
jgi:hypothetical protein